MRTSSDQETLEMAIGENIKKTRESKGLSQAKAAELCGISKDMWVKYEHGKASPTAEPIAKMARGLGISTDEILLEREERSVKQELRAIFDKIEKLEDVDQEKVRITLKAMLLVIEQDKF